MNLSALSLCVGLAALTPPAAHATHFDRVDDLVKRGREHLDKGELDQALELFTQADVEAKGALRGRMWVLRVWFEQGKINDAFDEVDRLAASNEGPDFDYLYGMGSYLKALNYLTQGVQNNTIGFSFQDAEQYLSSALKADPARFYDAWRPLARAAWESSHFDAAAKAIEGALKHDPRDAQSLLLAGRIAFQRANAVRSEADGADGAKKLDAEALDYFDRAAKAVAAPKDQSALMADIAYNKAMAQHYAGDLDGAAQSYGTAMSWNPGAVDVATVWSGIGLERVTKMLETAEQQFVEHWGKDSQADATLLWWLGSAYYSAQRYEECEGAYQQVLAKWPAYVDSNFYIAMSRYYREDYDGAILAWHDHAKANRQNLVQTLASNQELYVPVLSFVLSKAAVKAATEAPDHSLHCQFLAELRRDVAPDQWIHWNDLGLFARDAGDFLRRRGREGDEEQALKLYEQARESYQRAMEMAPEKPQLPNDLAVIYHYCLDRELDHALELYERSLKMATEMLERGGLSEEDQGYATTAKRDATNNIRRLKRKLAGEPDDEDDGL